VFADLLLKTTCQPGCWQYSERSKLRIVVEECRAEANFGAGRRFANVDQQHGQLASEGRTRLAGNAVHLGLSLLPILP
jgi:hypothetical protein